jgi:hypothetical protein
MSIHTNERRKENRVRITFPAQLSWNDESELEIIEEAFTVTVSNSGASLLTKLAPTVGKIIRVSLNIEGLFGSSFAEVRWAEASMDGFRIGVLFKLESRSLS